jgi:23S rRNA pseudouridine2605 synthase
MKGKHGVPCPYETEQAKANRDNMQERLQKIIGRAGIASRRHAEQLILSGQVRVNGVVVRELGTKADPATDKIEAAGRTVGVGTAPQRNIYLALHKPPEVVSAMADPEGRKTLRNCLRGLPERVFPVGNLEYAASGLVFLTNDGDLAAEMLKNWAHIEQVYHVKVKGMLTLADLDRIGKEVGVRMKTVRQPDATRGRAANFWYEVRMRDSKKDELRRLLMKEMHPMEKLMRIGLGALTVEGLPRGRYRLLKEKEVEELRRRAKPGNKDDLRFEEDKRVFMQRPQRTQWPQRAERPERTERHERSHTPRNMERPQRSGMPAKTEWPRRSHGSQKTERPQRNHVHHKSERPHGSQRPRRTGRDRKSPGGRPVPPRS